MRVYGRTDTGRVRASNQDAFVCGQLSSDTVYAVVCDGMGGANGGNVASSLAARIVTERLVENYRPQMERESVRNVLESAVAAANAEIYDAAMADSRLQGMGTTLVAAVLTGPEACIVHVGDSRAYRARRNDTVIEQVTVDHSVVQEMIASGRLTLEQAKNHPRRHFITRALGVEPTVEPDFTKCTLSQGEMLLLCTDGLTNPVEVSEIGRIARSCPKEEIADRLILAANMNGGSDNITVALLFAE